jgi:hypothetical protein
MVDRNESTYIKMFQHLNRTCDSHAPDFLIVYNEKAVIIAFSKSLKKQPFTYAF